MSSAVRDLVAPYLDGGVGLVDLGSHRLRDLSAPEHIYQLAAPDLSSDFPPILAVEERTTNLPVQTTSFVGRRAELEELRELLRRHRLVTLLGPGGTGKTRLALQAAVEIIEDFPDGTWLVELAPIGDGALVPQQIAAALRLPELDRDRLSSKRALIVLDNCEHLVDACASMATTLVQRCPGLTILATSREPLEVEGERLMRLAPLDVAEASRLFADRVSLVRPELVLDAAEASTVTEICRRLDGFRWPSSWRRPGPGP